MIVYLRIRTHAATRHFIQCNMELLSLFVTKSDLELKDIVGKIIILFLDTESFLFQDIYFLWFIIEDPEENPID